MARYAQRPNGAFKLLTYFLYSNYPDIWRVRRLDNMIVISINSIRKAARLLGTQSSNICEWVDYLERSGFLSNVSYSENRRRIVARIRTPYLQPLEKTSDGQG